MGASLYNIKKWLKMISGNSIMHTKQDIGKCYVPGELKGYFNEIIDFCQ